MGQATTHSAEAAVTSSTPELAPAGIDKAAVVNDPAAAAANTSTSATDAATTFQDPKTIDDLLGLEPAKDILPKAEIDLTSLINHPGQLQELGLDYGYGMTTMFEKTIEMIYLNSGLGWAGSIVIASVVVRSVTFFFQVKSSDKMAAMAALKPVTAPLQEKIEEAIARGDKQQEQVLKMQQAHILRPYMGGIFSMGGFMIMQGWIGFCAFRCLRAMSTLPVPGMANDGLLWFTDLTVRDPYFLLPATTTGIFYAIFKSGGETGISTDVGAQAMRGKMMTFFAFFMGLVTAFQPAGLQIYFLASGILGAATGWMLRQNGFRRMINIRPLPDPRSDAMYSKVIKGELKLNDIKGQDGKVRYQAPRAPTNRRKVTTLSGIKIKETTTIPAHLRADAPIINTENPDRDADFDKGPSGSLMEKLDYYRRNYRISYVQKRMRSGMEGFLKRQGYDTKTTSAQRRQKKRAEQQEIERRRRFENRS
ncbi:60Kd inner membrane protein-domain-containing protein [Phaeosphaeria sp. MPI-PUGE-AT-0046c]|nr:60Kd inner membrane protein-domain-containing protein [Phaeosphaeria sp. MPI-PUGE-AT-0046c]